MAAAKYEIQYRGYEKLPINCLTDEEHSTLMGNEDDQGWSHSSDGSYRIRYACDRGRQEVTGGDSFPLPQEH